MDTAGVEDRPGEPLRPEELALQSYLPHRLDVLSSVVSQVFSAVHATLGFTLPEWRVLVTLGAFGELNGKQVGVHTGMHKTAVSRIAHDLAARRLIERQASPVDQREVHLRLTAQGEQIYREGWPVLVAQARQIEEAIEPADREAFNRALLKLAGRAKQL